MKNLIFLALLLTEIFVMASNQSQKIGHLSSRRKKAKGIELEFWALNRNNECFDIFFDFDRVDFFL